MGILILLFGVFRLEFGNDLVRDIRRNHLVTGESHFKRALPLRHGAEFRRVFCKLRLRDFRKKHLHAVFAVHAENASALVIQMARDISHVFPGNDDLHGHDRLKQHGIRLRHCVIERAARCDLERHFRGVHIMELAVIDGHFHIFHDASCERAALHRLENAFFHGGNEILRDRAADNLVGELEFFLARFDPQINFRELPVSAGLFFMAVMAFCPAVDRFAVRHLRRGNDHIGLGQFLETAQRDLQMLFAHAAEDRLVGFMIRCDMQRRVAFAKLLKPGHDFFLVAALGRRDRVGDHGRGKFHLGHHMALVVLAERISGFCRTQLGDAADASRARLLDRNLILAVQENQMAEPFLRAVVQIQHVAVFPDLSGQDAEEGELPDVRINHGLEDECGGGTVLGGFHDRSVAGDTRTLKRALTDVDNAVHNLLDTDILRNAAGENRDQRTALERIMKSVQDFRLGQRLAAEITLHQRLVGLRDGVKQNLPAFRGVVLQVVGNLRGVAEHAHDAFEFRAASDGQRHRDGDVLSIGVLKLPDHLEEIRVVAVHAVHKRQFRNVEGFSKLECADGAAIDMPAGPSEVLVIADAGANPAFVAADLLSQAEHGKDSQVVLLTPERAFADRVAEEVDRQLETLPRKAIAEVALSMSRIIVTRDLETCVEISNRYAPEHLIVETRNAKELVLGIRNAGSVFLGDWSTESAGDYASGTNHVLPTYGYAKTYSSLGLADFERRMTIQEVTEEGLRLLGPAVEKLAQAEKLDAHKRAASIRLAALNRK